MERRLEPLQSFQRRVRSNTFITGNCLSLWATADGDRHDLRGEGAAFPSAGSAALTFNRKPILFLAANAVFTGNVLGRLPHVPVFKGTAKAVLDHGIDRLLVPDLPAGPGAEEQVRGPAHAFHAAGHEEVRVAGANGLGCEHDCLEPGAAHLVYGKRGNRVRESCLQDGLPSGVLTQARLEDAAHYDFIDFFNRYLGST